MTRGLFACVEVLMKPIAGRAIDASFAPFDVDDLILVVIRVQVRAPLFVPE
jgi:hypothetical protein